MTCVAGKPSDLLRVVSFVEGLRPAGGELHNLTIYFLDGRWNDVLALCLQGIEAPRKDWRQRILIQNLRSFSKRLFFFGLNSLSPDRTYTITPILLYHSIDDSMSLISVSPSCFLQQMKYLKEKNYNTLTLTEYCQVLLTNQSFPPRSVVITFDDGFENNYRVAFPILSKFGFKATIFLTIDYMGKECSWERTIDIPKLPMMSWDQVEEMSESGMEFGSHGNTHARLTDIPLGECKEEIVRSKSTIEKTLGKEIRSFCYPYGVANMDIMRAVEEAGYACACLGIFGCKNRIKNLFSLQRMNVNCTSYVDDTTRLMVFKACLNGSAIHFVRLREKASFLKGKPIPVIK